jgi:hypothetical protein
MNIYELVNYESVLKYRIREHDEEDYKGKNVVKLK